jgi:hypothetical protein
MSSSGYCIKRLSAARLGLTATPTPEWVQQSAEEGNWHEIRVKQELRGEGYVVYSDQDELKLVQPTYDLIGHIDGKVEDLNGNILLLEVKSMSQFQYDKWMRGGFTAFPQYAAQLACYFAGTNLDTCLYVVKNRNNGQRDTLHITKDSNALFDLEPILAKLDIVEEFALTGELCEAEYIVGNDECNFCEYKHLCLPERKSLEDIDRRVLEDAVEKYRVGKKLESRAKEIIDNSKSILEAYAKEQPEQKLFINDLAVSYYTVPEAPVSYIRKAYTACKIKDYYKENDNDS